MQPESAIGPELDLLGRDPEPAPERGPDVMTLDVQVLLPHSDLYDAARSMRTSGIPPLSTVARAMALGSLGSVFSASASQRRAMSNGSSPANSPSRSAICVSLRLMLATLWPKHLSQRVETVRDRTCQASRSKG